MLGCDHRFISLDMVDNYLPLNGCEHRFIAFDMVDGYLPLNGCEQRFIIFSNRIFMFYYAMNSDVVCLFLSY